MKNILKYLLTAQLLKKGYSQSGYNVFNPDIVVSGVAIISDSHFIVTGEKDDLQIFKIDPINHQLTSKGRAKYKSTDPNYSSKGDYYYSAVDTQNLYGRLTTDENFNVLFTNQKLRLLQVNPDGSPGAKDAYIVPNDVEHDTVENFKGKNYFLTAETTGHTDPSIPQRAFRLSSTHTSDIKNFELNYIAGGVCLKQNTPFFMVTPKSQVPRRIFDHTSLSAPVKTHKSNTLFEEEMTCMILEDEDLYFVTYLDNISGYKFTDETTLFTKNVGNGKIISTKRIPFTDLNVVSRIKSLTLTIYNFRNPLEPQKDFTFSGSYGQINQIEFFVDLRLLILVSGWNDDKIYILKMPQYPCHGICGTCGEIIREDCLTCGENTLKNALTNKCECLKGFWKDNKENKCNKCSPNCEECQDLTGDCLKCSFTFDLNSEKQCQKEEVKHELKLQEKNFLKKTQELHYRFSEEIDKNLNITEILSLNLTDKSNKTVEFSLESLKISEKNKQILIAKIILKKSIENGIFWLTNTTSLQSNKMIEGRRFRFKNDNITIENIDFFYSKSTETISKAAKPTQTTIKATSAITTVLSGSSGLAQVKLFQCFDILKFVNTELPLNFLVFLEIFNESFFDIFPNFLETEEVDITSDELITKGAPSNGYSCVDMHEKIKENDMKCYLLNNQGSIVLQFFGVLFLFLMVISCVFGGGKSENFLIRIMKKLKGFFGLGFWHEFLSAAQIELLAASFVNLRSLVLFPFVPFLSSFLSILLVVFYCWLIYVSFKYSLKMKKYEIKKQNGELDEKKIQENFELQDEIKKIEKWSFMKEDMKNSKESLKMIGYHYKEITLLKNMLIPLNILLFMNHPLVQIISSLVIYATSLVILAKSRPFAKKRTNFISIANEICYTIVLVIFLIINLSKDNMASESKYKIYGNFLIIVTCICILFNLVIGFIDSFYSLRDFFREKCGKKNKLNSVGDVNGPIKNSQTCKNRDQNQVRNL